MATPERLGFAGLSVHFGSTVALDGLDLSLRPGEIVGLLGHNGAGKSTVLNVATGAVAATAGRMRLDGVDLPSDLTPGQVAALGIAVIHQEPALAPNLSVFDNLFLADDRLADGGAQFAQPHELGLDVGFGNASGHDTARGGEKGRKAETATGTTVRTTGRTSRY